MPLRVTPCRDAYPVTVTRQGVRRGDRGTGTDNIEPPRPSHVDDHVVVVVPASDERLRGDDRGNITVHAPFIGLTINTDQGNTDRAVRAEPYRRCRCDNDRRLPRVCECVVASCSSDGSVTDASAGLSSGNGNFVAAK
jgi:hypothetical protein